MTSVLENMDIDKLDDIVNKYNNSQLSAYIDFSKKNDQQGRKFKVSNHIKISKYKKNLQSVTFQTVLKKFL